MPAQIMAIINTSPDSFSGDGIHIEDINRLRQHIQKAIDDGADILDIGGQSTRPGARVITEEREVSRIVPAIQIVREISTSIPISIDTFKPTVAEAAFLAGANILNDVTGFQNRSLVAIALKTKCDIVVMHTRGTSKTMSTLTNYPEGVVPAIISFFTQRTNELVAAGIAHHNIIIDPGIGFAKTAAQSYELTYHLTELKKLGFRVLYGASQKSFIGKALMENGVIAPVEGRIIGTTAVQTCALLQGADIVRVHDVESAVQTRTIVEALLGQREVTA